MSPDIAICQLYRYGHLHSVMENRKNPKFIIVELVCDSLRC